jgi:hypothetical protein
MNKSILNDININNELLKLQKEIMKINNICEILRLSKISTYIKYYHISYNSLYITIVLFKINVIIILYCIQYKNDRIVIITLNLLIGLTYFMLIYFKNSNGNYKQLINKRLELKNKRDDINFYIKMFNDTSLN